MAGRTRRALLASFLLLIAAVRCALDASTSDRERLSGVVTKQDRDGRKWITIDVPGAKPYKGTIDFEGKPIPGTRTLGGTLSDEEGAFTIADYKGLRFIHLYLAGKAIEIVQPLNGGEPTVRETDTTAGNLQCGTGRSFPRSMTSALTGCGDPECDAARTAVEGARTDACLLDPTPKKPPILIKALIAYTDEVETEVGASNIYPLILSAYTLTNTAFKRSRLGIEFGIASEAGTPCVIRAPYSESVTWHRMENDLKRLFDPFDFELAHLHTFRDKCNADVVLLITENKFSYISGKTCVMERLSRYFAPYAFAVVKRESIAANYAFTHELGHMMGAGHVNVAGECRAAMCDYSAGWTFAVGAKHLETVMGDDTSRRNVLHFSDPNVPYGRTGLSTGDSTANNARTLRISARTVSEFRAP